MIGVVLAFGFLFTAWASGRAALADVAYRENTFESIQRSVALAPDNAVFRALLAEHLEGTGQDPKPQLVEITRLTPLESQYWIRRAFRAEVERDYAQAEIFLQRASAVDHKAAPRWALMNFYFRQGQSEKFWTWFTRALTMSRGDVTAIFRLAWDQSTDARFVLSQLLNRQDTLIQYFNFLIDSQRFDAAEELASRVATFSPPEETERLMAYCDRYVQTKPRLALSVWNPLCSRKVIPFSALNPAMGQFVTNGDLDVDPTGRGFDWRIPPVEGAFVGQGGHGIHIELNGNQPEDCVILRQIVPLEPGKSYEITWESSPPLAQTLPGLAWEVLDEVAAATPPASGFATDRLRFTARGQSGELRLHYKRPLGTTRARGEVNITAVRGGVAQ